jgi:hypothetical protein
MLSGGTTPVPAEVQRDASESSYVADASSISPEIASIGISMVNAIARAISNLIASVGKSRAPVWTSERATRSFVARE